MSYIKVISGYLKGRELFGYNVETTRPTMSRVKESMFASIQNYISDSIVLDLFCGTGSLGIEAISMGANKCYFVDNNRDIIKYLKCNKQWSVEQISLLYNYLYTQGIDRVHCLDEHLETIERNNETEQLFILKEVIEAIEELMINTMERDRR